jgi:hypothetical protein
MNTRLTRLSWALTAALSVALAGNALAQAQEVLLAKQLAGAPEEFAAMAPVAPIDAAIASNAALIPVTLSQVGERSSKGGARGADTSWSARLPLDAELTRVMLIAGDSDWQLEINGADQQLRSAAALAHDHGPAQFGIEGASVAGTRFAFAQDGAASRQFQIRSASGAQTRGFLLIEGSEQTRLVSYQAERNQQVGQSISVLAELREQAGRNPIHTASLEVTAPSGALELLAMADDGQHGDGEAGDGLYGAVFHAQEAGDYRAQVLAYGENSKGDAVVRSAEHLIPVVADQLSFGRSLAQVRFADKERIEISVPLNASKAGQHYRAYAQVWGKDQRGADVAVAWVGGMVTPNHGEFSLSLDARWLTLAGATGPLELRDLRIEDPDHFISLAQAKSVSLQGEIKAPAIARDAIVIDEAMTMGERPAQLAFNRGVGQRLLLVHGYCSGAVWPAANFTNASTFLDANQNRSHDQFAQRISSFGSTWNSYGIVAHSQGGAAALHLYNYYWSGLDNATGARLIQSVGTPYKGTNLAGVLAALGGIFGVGCGTQSDLTYSGATSWLAGISTASRAKVNYHTTSFRSTNWWTNDYCNFASDLVLSDPEDGTTEQTNGQLSGGVNRGHVTGQCHTDGMRDPAQYRDSSRNSTMNSNAAR